MEIRLDFISADTLSEKGTIEKIDFILHRIKENVIVVLEEGLDPTEETELIEATMREIDTKNFHGIEFYRMDHKSERIRDKIADYISGRRSGLTIVGPTRMVEAIKKEENYISMLAKSATSRKKRKAKTPPKTGKKRAAKKN
ncbi:MAG: DUF2073 domain-containing protein [Candidatus Hydrothermarchaeales archaeon]